MTKCRIIIRVDDEATTVALVTGKGRQSRISWAGVATNRQPADLAEFVGTKVPNANPQKCEVLLMLGDRRLISGKIERDSAPARRDLGEILRREAQAKGMFSDDEALGIGYRVGRTGQEWHAYFEAAPEQIFAPYITALQEYGYGTIRVVSTANVLAQGIAKTNEPVGIVDTRGSASYFVLAQNQQTLATRKILLTSHLEQLVGEEQSAESLLPLGSELARSVGFFEDQGLPRPTRIVFTTAKARDIDLPSALEDMLEIPCVACDEPALTTLPQDLPQPHIGWASHAFASTCLDRKTTPFLADITPPRVVRTDRRGILSGIGIAAMLTGLTLILLARMPENAGRSRSYSEQQEELAAMQAELETERSLRTVPQIVVERSEILKALTATTISLSRVCAILGNERPDGLRLTRITLRNKRLTLEGMIRDQDGLGAVASFSLLDERISQIPGLAGGSGSIGSDKDSGRDDDDQTDRRSSQSLRFTYRIHVGAKP